MGLQSLLGCSVSNQSLVLTISPANGNLQVLPVGTILRFTVSSVTNPPSMEASDTFQVFISSSPVYNYYIQQLTAGLSLANTVPNVLNNA